MVLVIDTHIPEDVSISIRLQLKEKSQIDKKIGARFLYVPYQLSSIDGKIFSELHHPIAIGFSAEYIVS